MDSLTTERAIMANQKLTILRQAIDVEIRRVKAEILALNALLAMVRAGL